MDVDVAVVGVDIAAAVEARFETVEPEDSVGDGGVGMTFLDQARGLASAEDRALRRAGTDLVRDAVESQGRAMGVLLLAESDAGGGDDVFADQREGFGPAPGIGAGVVGLKMGEPLRGRVDGEDVRGERRAAPRADAEEFVRQGRGGFG